MRTVSASFVLGLAVLAASGALAQTPSEFASTIRPIMERSCWNCHGEAVQLSGYRFNVLRADRRRTHAVAAAVNANEN